MSREYHIEKAMNRAVRRDNKHKKRMRVTGASVFALRKLLRAKKP